MPPFSLSIRPIATCFVVAVVFFALALAANLGAGAAIQNTVTHYFVVVVMVVGLGVFVGNTGVLSFGHMAFVALAAYASALLTLPLALKGSLLPNLPTWLAETELGFVAALILAVAMATLVGTLAGYVITRLSGAAAAIATLGLLIITNSVLIGAADITRGSQAIYGVPKEVGVYAGAAFAVLAVAIARVFKDSRFGMLARATREDEMAAQSLGIRVPRARLYAWSLSVALAAVGGVLFAHHLGVFSPREFYFTQTFALLVMLIVGGMASVSGAVTGATLVVVLIEVLRRVEEGGSILGVSIPAMYGLTDIGLSVAVLITLYRSGTGLLGYREFDDLFPGRPHDERAPAVEASRSASVEATSRDALSAHAVAKRYGGVVALAGVDLTLRPGEIVGLIGPNGSGKTTLLSCLAGVFPPSGGEISVDGHDLTNAGAADVARAGIGRTFQNIRLFHHLTVLENVEAGLLAAGEYRSRSQSRPAARALLSDIGLADHADRIAGTLAYGQQRRLEIARALGLRPRYLLLDEPAAGMNDAESQELVGFLSDLRDRRGLGVLIIEHDLHLILTLCDRVIVINKGEVIAEGPPEDVRRHPDVIHAYMGRRHTAGDTPSLITAQT